MSEPRTAENDAPIEDVEARRRMARRFMAAQARALNAAARSGPLARVRPGFDFRGRPTPPASTEVTR